MLNSVDTIIFPATVLNLIALTGIIFATNSKRNSQQHVTSGFRETSIKTSIFNADKKEDSSTILEAIASARKDTPNDTIIPPSLPSPRPLSPQPTPQKNTPPSKNTLPTPSPPHVCPLWKLLRGDVPERGPLRSGSYCGAALHGRYLMVLASAPRRVRPERKDGDHPDLCNAPPQ